MEVYFVVTGISTEMFTLCVRVFVLVIRFRRINTHVLMNN